MDVHVRKFRGIRSRKMEEVIHDFRCAERLFCDFLQQLVSRIFADEFTIRIFRGSVYISRFSWGSRRKCASIISSVSYPSVSSRQLPVSDSKALFQPTIRPSTYTTTTPTLMDSIIFSLKSIRLSYSEAFCSSDR